MPSDDTRNIGDIGREAAEVGARGLDAAGHRVRSLFEQQSERVAHHLDEVANALHEAATHLAAHNNGTVAEFANGAAERIGEAADFLKQASLDQVAVGVETFARQRPRVFLGGAIATGFLLTRLTKASSGRSRARLAGGGEIRP